MMTMRVDRRRYRTSNRRSNSMNFDQADKKVSSASTSSTVYSRIIRRRTYHSDYGRKRSRYDPPNSSPWDGIASLPTCVIRASGPSATRKSNLLFNDNTEEDGEKITESNLLYINLKATSVELAEMGPMSFSVKDSDHKKKQEEQEMTDMEEEMENLRNERERKKRAKEQQRVSMPGLKTGSSTYFRPKKFWL